MKKIRSFALAAVGIAVFAVSCKKDDPITPNNPDPTGNNQALSNYFNDREENSTQTFTIDATLNQSITGVNGTVVNFYPNSFVTSDGTPVIGNVEIKLIEIYKKSDMIRMNKPTMGNLPGGGMAPLISGGEFKVTASQNGQEVFLAPGMNYNVIAPAPNGVDPNMEIFYGNESGDTLTWNQADSSLVFGEQGSYYGYFDSLNWINFDYFMNNPNPQTTVRVQIPAGYTNQTCAVFVSFDGLNSISTFYNYSGGIYTTAPNYTLPIGTEVHFVAMAIIGGVPQVAIVPSTIVDNHLEVITELTATTDSQFETDLNNLP